MSFWTRMKELFVPKKTLPRGDLSDLSLKILASETLKERLDAMKALHDFLRTPPSDDPIGAVQLLKEKLNALNETIRVASVPYQRSERATMMTAWERLSSYAEDIRQYVESILSSRGPVEQKALIRQIEGLLNIDVFPYAMMIVAASYLPADVAPSWALVVQQMAPMGYGGITPTSGGQISQTYPQGGPYPPRMSSRIGEKENE